MLHHLRPLEFLHHPRSGGKIRLRLPQGCRPVRLRHIMPNDHAARPPRLFVKPTALEDQLALLL